MSRRYNSFSSYMKKRFNTNVYKVIVDAGFNCPNRDGRLSNSGCIYCNNNSFKPDYCRPTISISKQIEDGISYMQKRYNASLFLVYFQPYTNTYAPVKKLERLYREALSRDSVIGLTIGTRPDCIDEEKISLLESLSKDYFILIEYGMQSMYDKSLKFINRGHDYRTFLKAIELTKGRNIFIGAHLIVGLPTETREEMLLMADEISQLPIDFLKIHHLQVIKDTPLEVIYRDSPFHLFGYEEYLDFLIDFIERLSPHIVLERLFSTAPDNILIAPQWYKSKQEILSAIVRNLETKDTYQGKKCRLTSSQLS